MDVPSLRRLSLSIKTSRSLGTLSRRKSAVTATGSVAAMSAANTNAVPAVKSGTIARPRNATLTTIAVIPMAATTPGIANAATGDPSATKGRRIDVEGGLEQQPGKEHGEEKFLRQMLRLDRVERSEHEADDHQRDRIGNGQAPDRDRDRRRDAKQNDAGAYGSHRCTDSGGW